VQCALWCAVRCTISLALALALALALDLAWPGLALPRREVMQGRHARTHMTHFKPCIEPNRRTHIGDAPVITRLQSRQVFPGARSFVEGEYGNLVLFCRVPQD
jgi:hypothetical protein